MTDRWFSERELSELSRPTMDRAVEAIDAGELDQARRLCTEMKHEWQMLHDLMAGGVLDLVSFIQQQLGDAGGAEAWRGSRGRAWVAGGAATTTRSSRSTVASSCACWPRRGARTPAPGWAPTRAASRSPRTRRR